MKSKNKNNREETHNEIAGILLFALAIFILLSLISHQTESYFLGIVGRAIGNALNGMFEYGAYMLPLLIGIWGWINFRGIVVERVFLRLISIIVLMLCVCSFLNMAGGRNNTIGGTVGNIINGVFLNPFGKVGSFIIVLTVTVIFISLLTGISLKEMFKGIRSVRSGIEKRKKRVIVKKSTRDEKIILLQKQKEKELENRREKEKEKKRKAAEKEARKKGRTTAGTSPDPSENKPAPGEKIEYKMPVLELLDAPPVSDVKQAQGELNEKAKILENTLRNFSISARVKKIYPGPVITRYEIELAPGVRVSAVSSLSNDIALALKARSVRLLAPIPGKSAVGIEIPNADRKTIFLRELIQSNAYRNSGSLLTLALGKTVAGEDYVDNLAQMPHLLVAGATGSGKSVCLNSIIISMLYKTGPEEVKFILIDPKMVELPIYNGIRHLVSPVVTSVKEAVIALEWAVSEMDRRYKKFSKHIKRDIIDYNNFARKSGQEEPIPFIVIIIDELADLMTLATKQVEKSVLRLAQMSRAVGIHLILATQRPSVDVITGVIKTNIPARIAFQVVSRVDSTIILDMGGAESLIGRGDMLYLPSGAPKPVRLQGGFVKVDEIEKLVNYIKLQGTPDYSGGFLDILKKSKDGLQENKEEKELIKKACTLIIERKQASTSLLKGALRISDGKASNIVSLLETKELIGPSQGSKPREVFIEKIKDYLKGLEEAG